jgi:hypothetical protein
MNKYSPAFIAALTGMSLITHAHAETNALTPEQIERMYIDEVKVAGKTLQCFQAGQEIIHEVGLQNVEETSARIIAMRLDGSAFEIMHSDNSGLACTIITRKKAE